MDADRKSTVSSFYGARKSSMDALNQDFPSSHPPSGAGRPVRDDASSFFSPDQYRSSTDRLGGRRTSAGYNASTFYPGREEPLKGGRDEEEEEAWDVYADFNNAGPRYSTAFGLSNTVNSQGYQPLEPPTPSPKVELEGTNSTPVEMVTVPALGAEWSKDELHDMTKSAKAEKKRETRKERWKRWNRGETGMCGSFCNRKTFVWFSFGLCVLIALVVAFCIPRVPSFSFNSQTPLVNATGEWGEAIEVGFSRAPANFSFPAFASLQLSTDNNFVPITFEHMRAEVFDLDTGSQVGTGDLLHSTRVPAREFPQILLPLNFTYIATNDTDQTWVNWYNACKNKLLYPTPDRSPAKFRLVITLDIFGLPGNPVVSTQVADADCPIELPITV